MRRLVSLAPRPTPLTLKTFLITFALNLVTAVVLVKVSDHHPHQRGYFYATIAALFAVGLVWAVVAHQKRKP